MSQRPGCAPGPPAHGSGVRGARWVSPPPQTRRRAPPELPACWPAPSSLRPFLRIRKGPEAWRPSGGSGSACGVFLHAAAPPARTLQLCGRGKMISKTQRNGTPKRTAKVTSPRAARDRFAEMSASPVATGPSSATSGGGAGRADTGQEQPVSVTGVGHPDAKGAASAGQRLDVTQVRKRSSSRRHPRVALSEGEKGHRSGSHVGQQLAHRTTRTKWERVHGGRMPHGGQTLPPAVPR